MGWTAWLAKWLRPRPRLTDWRVVLYTRRGCHLCDVGWARLQHARRRHGFALEAVDVDGDPALRERHGDWVPVVEVNGRWRLRGGVNPVLLERLLRAEVLRRQREG